MKSKKGVLPSRPALLSGKSRPSKRPKPSHTALRDAFGTDWDAFWDTLFGSTMRVGTEGRFFSILKKFLGRAEKENNRLQQGNTLPATAGNKFFFQLCLKNSRRAVRRSPRGARNQIRVRYFFFSALQKFVAVADDQNASRKSKGVLKNDSR